MCGIAGLLDPTGATTGEELAALAGAMAAPLRHRGPDDGGVWVDAAGGVAFGHRRLSIVDLSVEGHQPMRSGSGRYTLTYNGEIYNHGELRGQLTGAGHRFRGHSDTEVLLAAVEEWGLHGALRRSNGMFALALWDGRDRVLSLARDRLGEKPLYYGWAGRHLVFGSELKALRAHSAFDPPVDRGALALLLRYSFVPSPYCIYAGVRKLPAGTVLTVLAGGGPPGAGLADPEPFWRLHEVAARGVAGRFPGRQDDAVDRLDALLRDAVGIRMHADVPLGAFLSGGVDSSLVVALMQAQAARPVRTFTIAMPEAGFDESADARRVAAHLGTDHTEVELSPGAALDIVPTLPHLYDEPFADPSQLPTALLCAVTRRHVTVSLSGDGGDEVFGGYNRYVHGRRAWRRLSWMPPAARRAMARPVRAVRPATWDALGARLDPLLPARLRVRNPGDKARKLAGLLEASDPGELYLALVSQWDPRTVVRPNGQALVEPPTPARRGDHVPLLADLTEQMMFLDTAVGLPDDMLTKVDRASMAVGLEARVPLLDHRVVELTWSLPPAWKAAGGQGKAVLRRVLDRYVPRELIERPKMGFDPPVGAWLRGPLRAWAESLLDGRRLADDGLIDPAPVRAVWADHLSGRANRDYELWAVLMFQAWRTAGS